MARSTINLVLKKKTIWQKFFFLACGIMLTSACTGIHNVKDIEIPRSYSNTQAEVENERLFKTGSPEECTASQKRLDLIKNYIISVDKDGEYQPLKFSMAGCGREKGEKYFTQPKEFPTHIDNIINAIFSPEDARRTNVLIFIHGGLNTFDDRTQRAILHSYLISQATIGNGERYYPLFINWPSGLDETYWEQISNIRQGDEKARAIVTFPLYFLSDLMQGFARLPATWEKTNFREIGTKIFGDIKEKCDAEGDFPETIICEEKHDRDLWVRAKRVATFIPLYPIRLFASLPVDSFGKTAWVNMLRRTQTMLRNPEEFKYRNKSFVIKEEFNGTGHLAIFLRELGARLKTEPEYSLTLIGHSMGAIIANQIIRAFPDLPYKNLVYMAAACSILDFEHSVIPVLLKAKEKQDIHFYNLSLDPHAEAREYTVKGLGPTGSLLEWIDDFYTDPPTLRDRTLGKWRNIVVAKRMFPKKALHRMTFKVFNWDEDHSPIQHGDFTELKRCYWDPVFWKEKEAYLGCKYHEILPKKS